MMNTEKGVYLSPVLELVRIGDGDILTLSSGFYGDEDDLTL